MPSKCNFCDCVLASEYSLATHQKTAKKCLIKQGIVLKGDFKCDLCNKTFIHKSVVKTHILSCIKKIVKK